MLIRNYLVSFSSVLFYLLPLSLLTGPLIPEIIIFIISLTFLIFSLKENSWFYFRNYFSYGFIFFYLYIVIRSLTSLDPYLSLENSLFYFRFGLFALATWFLIINQKNFIKLFSIFFVLTFLLAIVDGYYQFFHAYNLFGFNSPDVRMTLTLNDDLYLGGYLSRMFPLLFAVLLFSFYDNKYMPIIFLIIFVTTDILVYITGERTGFALLTLSAVFIILLINKYKRTRIISVVLSIIIISLITIYSPILKDRNITTTYNQITGKVDAKSGDESNSSYVIFSPSHHKILMTSYNMFKEKPIFGHGPKMFRVLCDNPKYSYNDYSCSTHPHNNYFQALAEIGIFGLSFIIAVIFMFCYLLLRHLYFNFFYSKRLISDYQITLIACFFLSLWPFLPTQNLFNNWINIVYYLPVGFYLHSINSKRNDITR
mgnify:FL=1